MLMQMVLGYDMRLLYGWVVGGDWYGVGGLAWLAEQQPEWILGVVDGTLGLIGRPSNELCVAIGQKHW